MYNISDILLLCDKVTSVVNMRSQDFILQNSRYIDAALQLFSDEESRYNYVREIAYFILSACIPPNVLAPLCGVVTVEEYENCARVIQQHGISKLFESSNKGNSENYKAMDLAGTFLMEQYRYNDLVGVEKGDICFDGGAYIGDTAVYFMKNGAKGVYAFECYEENLQYLKKNIIKLGYKDNIHICEKALSDKTGEITFSEMESNITGGSIAIDRGGPERKVQAITIDDFCEKEGVYPNFIKMDIEGAEVKALNGAKKTIQQHRPKLAISIYHTIDDRWKIPLLIYSFVPDYKFYVKRASPYGETILFAVP